MSRKEKALAFFGRYLPEKLLATIDLDTLTLYESKHVSDAGVSLYNDVLYRCICGILLIILARVDVTTGCFL